jgi:hypothetical protein
MQLRLEFLEEKDGRRAKQLPRWERLAESARLEAAKRLAPDRPDVGGGPGRGGKR